MNTKHSLISFSLIFASVTWLFLLVANSEPAIFNNSSFAQTSATTTTTTNNPLNSAAAGGAGRGDINKPVQFNNYENNQLGVSLKYPSNFLIDESKSNNTLQQISFYPTNYANISPENQILWMDVFVQTLNPNSQQQQQPLSSLSNDNSSFSNPSINSPQSNFDIITYSQKLANFIQQGNQDVTIIEGSNNTLLSGYPAYKLITKSHINNSTIDDVLISTILNNKVYSLNYQTDSSNYLDSLPTANKIIQSFKINPQNNTVTIPMGVTEGAGGAGGGNVTLPSNENLNLKQPNANTAANIPLVENLMSSLKLNNITNNSPEMLKNLKNSIENSLTNILADSKITLNRSISNPSSIPSSASSTLSSLPSSTLEKVCSIPLVSQICSNNGIGNVGVNSTNGSGAASAGRGGGVGVGVGGLNTENNLNSGISVNGTNNNNNNNNKLENQIENTLKNILGANNNLNSGISLNDTKNNINSLENTLKNILGANNNNIQGNLTEGLNNVPGLNKLTNSFSNPSSSQLSNELSSMFSNLFSSNPSGNGR
jgi:hypothetical protein